eukprot:CAMPEP_0173196080 /NCGR_PEP_ID=MMETSP1141-20130122/15414_1 /TAXON_ID=483371 /ORGANISM="non described non described, Strain CCMP2298" /LENGTH=130 /DNA_ID=CAMNT_0014120685 /DNA_START=354 /DNA_END=745 /DNA_ORIENTATION=-
MLAGRDPIACSGMDCMGTLSPTLIRVWKLSESLNFVGSHSLEMVPAGGGVGDSVDGLLSVQVDHDVLLKAGLLQLAHGQGGDDGLRGNVAHLALNPDSIQLVLLQHLSDNLHVLAEDPVLLREEEALLAI